MVRLLAGGMAYSLDPSGRAKLVVGYLNTAHVPAAFSGAQLLVQIAQQQPQVRVQEPAHHNHKRRLSRS